MLLLCHVTFHLLDSFFEEETDKVFVGVLGSDLPQSTDVFLAVIFADNQLREVEVQQDEIRQEATCAPSPRNLISFIRQIQESRYEYPFPQLTFLVIF